MVLVAFCAAPTSTLTPDSALTLTQLGHYDPDLSSTSDPPPCCLIHDFPDLRDYLAKVRGRVAGKPLSDLVCVEVFAGFGGSTAAIRKAGVPGPSGWTTDRPRTPDVPAGFRARHPLENFGIS